MKIIGKAGDDSFIITATADELAQLIGWSSDWSMRRSEIRNHAPKLLIGDVIMVGPMYKQLYELSRVSPHLAAAKRTLLEAAALLDLASPMIPVVVVEDPKP